MSAAWQDVLVSIALATVNAVAVAAAAPILDGVRRGVAAAVRLPSRDLSGLVAVATSGRGWGELARTARRTATRVEDAGPVLSGAPAASLAASLAVLPLLPGPAFDPGLGRVADLPTLMLLLLLGRGVLLLGALASGHAGTALRAHALLLGTGRAALGVSAAMLALFVVAGEVGLDQVAVALHGAAHGRREAAVLVGGALAAALLSAGDALPDAAWSGTDLALCRYAAMLRAAGWIELVSVVTVPNWLAGPGASAGSWLEALLCWPVRLLGGAALLGTAQQLVARYGLRRELLGLSLLLSVLAVLVPGSVVAIGGE